MKILNLFIWCSLLFFLLLPPSPAWAAETRSQEMKELFNLATQHIQTSNYQQARQELTTIIDRDQTDTRAYLYRCFAYFQLEDYLESLADCSEVIKLDPQAKEAYLHRGLTNYRLGRYPQSLIDYDRLIVINPQNYRAYYNRGLSKVAMKNYQGAIADYDQALNNIPPEEDTKIALVYNDRGLAYFLQGDSTQAKADFNHGIALNRRDARTYFNLACLYNHEGSFQKAIANFTSSLELDPKQPVAYQSRAILYKTTGNLSLALADLYQAAKSYGDQEQISAYQNTMEMIKAIEQERLDASDAIAISYF